MIRLNEPLHRVLCYFTIPGAGFHAGCGRNYLIDWVYRDVRWVTNQQKKHLKDNLGDLLPVSEMACTLVLLLFWYCLLVSNPVGFLPHHISYKNNSTEDWFWDFAEGESVSWLWSGGQVNITVRFLCLPTPSLLASTHISGLSLGQRTAGLWDLLIRHEAFSSALTLSVNFLSEKSGEI